jgi:hypothetical protein
MSVREKVLIYCLVLERNKDVGYFVPKIMYVYLKHLRFYINLLVDGGRRSFLKEVLT